MSNSGIPYWRLSGFYFFYFALLGAMVPYWSLFLEHTGFSAPEIGQLGAIMMGTKILSPYLWGWLADISGQRMRVIRAGSLLSFICFCFIFAERTFLSMALVVAGFTFFWNAVLSQFEVVTLKNLAGRFARYSSIRVWGSVGFILTVSLLGIVFDFVSVDWLPVFMLFLLAGIWLSSLLVSEPSAVIEHESTQGLATILYRPIVMAFFVVCFLLQVAHGPYYTFYSIYLQDYGFSSTSIGMLWALGVLAEVVVFLFMHRFMQRYSLRQIMLFSLLVSVARWLLIAFYPEQIFIVLLAQLGHAATFGSFHAIAVEMVRRLFGGKHQGQGQALYSAMSFGAGGAVGAIVSGYVWVYSQQLAWSIASAASLIAVLVAYVYIRDEKIVIANEKNLTDEQGEALKP